MDITYYFNNKTTQNTNLYTKKIQEYATSKQINAMEYTFMTNFGKDKGSLINIKWILEILKKINNTEFNNICIKTFPHLLKNINSNITTDINGIAEKMNIFKKGIIEYTFDQKLAIYNTLNFLSNNNQKSFGIYGFAGTGKTTLISELFYFLISEKYIKSVAFTAPTNKALDVLKGKFRDNLVELYKKKLKKEVVANFNIDDILDELLNVNIKIDFLTVHRLLKYKSDVSTDGERIFVKGSDSNIANYEVILIDECSMISLQVVTHIYEEIRECDEKYKKVPKIIFSGDTAQLPPVNERVSSVFIKSPNDINVKNFNNAMKNIETKQKLSQEERLTKLTSDILEMENVVMKEVVRNKLTNVVNLCYNIRQWITNEVKYPVARNYVGNGVFIYKNDKKNKTDTLWFKNYISHINETTSNIILTWTNPQSDEYNASARKVIFKDKDVLNKFEVGDILMLNDYYNIDAGNKNKEFDDKKRFYTSEQIRVMNIEQTNYKSCEFSHTIPKSLDKLKNIIHISTRFTNFIKTINYQTKRSWNVWVLYVHRQSDTLIKNIIPEEYKIYTIHESSVKMYENEKKQSNELIRKFKTNILKEFKEQSKYIDKYLIRQLWKDWNKIYIDPIAKVNYGNSLTIHKSQGSQFYNVYIDVDNVLNNPEGDEAKRCLYTALTRSANEIHLLV